MKLESTLDAQSARLCSGTKWVSFGISFLNDCLLGLSPDDLLLLGAYSGVGKTEIATQIALNAGRMEKRVHFFSLESAKGEITDRIIWSRLTRRWFQEHPLGKPGVFLRYRTWKQGLLHEELGGYEKEIRTQLSIDLETVEIVYREKYFDIEKFIKIFDVIKNETDLVIIDHIHYFDSTDENENRALKTLVKKLRDATLCSSVPTIILGHLRKQDRKNKNALPDIDDFYGASDLTKIATEVVLMARAEKVDSTSGNYPVWLYLPKSRTAPDTHGYAGLLSFDVKTGKYSKRYQLHKLKRFEEPEEIKEALLLPHWAKNALVPERTF